MSETPAQQANKSTVKVSNGYKGRPRPLTSDKDTLPIKDVFRDGKVIQGISEKQMISEGWRAPLQYQNAETTKEFIEKQRVTDPTTGDKIIIEVPVTRVVQVGRFQKTKQERAELKLVHSGAKGPSGGSSKTRSPKETKSTLIIHRANLHHKKDFTTTISVQAYPSEVAFFIAQYHNPHKHKLIVKYHYRGETLRIA